MRLTKAVINTRIKRLIVFNINLETQIMNKQDAIIQTAWKRIRFLQSNK